MLVDYLTITGEKKGVNISSKQGLPLEANQLKGKKGGKGKGKRTGGKP
jgi:hypothetical protein